VKDRRFFILFMVIFVSALGFSIIAPLIPMYMREMGESGFGIGMLFAGYSISRVIFTPIIGEISDRKGRKAFISGGLLLYALVSLSYIWAGNLVILAVVRFLHGFSSVLITPIALAYGGEIAKEGREGRAMALFNAAIFTGIGTGPLLGAFMIHHFDQAAVFYVLASLAALSSIVTLLFLPETERVRPPEDGFAHLGALMKKDILKLLVVWGVSAPMGIAVVLSFVPMLSARLGLPPGRASVIISVCVFMIVLFLEPFGKLADKARKYQKFFILFTGQLVISVALLFSPACDSLATLLFAAAVIGIGTAVAYPVGSDIAVLIGRRVGMGSSIGLLSASKSAGAAITPIVAGLVYDAFGLNAAFYCIAILILVCKLVCYYYTGRLFEERRYNEKTEDR